MASIETTAFILGILAGVAFGLFWAYKILKKRQRNIPKDILEDFEKISKILLMELLSHKFILAKNSNIR